MKKAQIVLATVLMATASLASATPYESDYFSSDTIDSAAAQHAAQIIQQYGYVCSSLLAVTLSTWSGDVGVRCNGGRYVYTIKDVGGHWEVTVD